MTIPKAIVALRRARRETQQQLATKLELSVSAIHKYETGRNPDPPSLFRLLEAAEECRRHPHLAQIFRDEFYRSLGVTPDRLLNALCRPPAKER